MTFLGFDLNTSTSVALGEMELASNVRTGGRSLQPFTISVSWTKLPFGKPQVLVQAEDGRY
jgi:hypothetical protein